MKFLLLVLPFVLLLQDRPASSGKPPAGEQGPGKKRLPVPPWIRDAVAGPGRPEGDRRRDADRRPGEVLAFFGIRPEMKVAEMMAGTGYYAELLARTVGPQGRVYAQNNSFVLSRFADKPLTARLKDPTLSNVVRLDRELEDPGLPEGLDAVLMIRFYHDTYWQKTDRKKMNRAIFRALKPGGVFGVVDHQAEAGSGDRDVLRLHRVDEAMVEREILAAGFVLDAESDVLKNPDDPRDFNIFADGAKNRDRTDRFVLRFRKPVPPAPPR
ncbi:MAG: class I SAM-dependent methyltransferase [Planctomycetota bacterium]